MNIVTNKGDEGGVDNVIVEEMTSILKRFNNRKFLGHDGLYSEMLKYICIVDKTIKTIYISEWMEKQMLKSCNTSKCKKLWHLSQNNSAKYSLKTKNY